MKILRHLSIALITVFGLISCSSDKDNDTITNQTFSNFVAVVNDLTTGGTAYYNNVSFFVELNYSRMIASVQISGLKLPDGTTYPTLTVSDVPWNISSDGWKTIKGTSLPSHPSGSVGAFTSFEFKIYERILTENDKTTYSPGVCANFTIDGRYKIVCTYSPQTLNGKATVTSEGNTYTSNNSEYICTLNTDTRMLSILMNKAQFAPGMPALNMELRSIPVTLRGTNFDFDVEHTTPYIEGTAFDAFPITELKGSFNPASGLNFSFICAPRTQAGSYNVTVNADYSSQMSY